MSEKEPCPTCGSDDTGKGAGGYIRCRRCGSVVGAPKTDPRIGDPEMGGFRPGLPQPIPSRFASDEFFRGKLRAQGRAANQQTEQQSRTRTSDEYRDASKLRSDYVQFAHAGLWEECEESALALLQHELKDHDRADAFYALGFAREQRGNQSLALNTYKVALKIESNHQKAARRHAALLSRSGS